MRRILAAATFATLVLAGISDRVDATAVHVYKRSEYPIIAGGLAPNKQFSITVHGTGEFGSDDFHVYLTAQPAHKVIAPLSSIGADNILDSAPVAFHAQWSPDSRHVAVLFRSDRHYLEMLLYEIRNGRPYEVRAPDLFDEAIGHVKISADDYEVRSNYTEIKWLSPARFTLKLRRYFEIKSPDFVGIVGKYGKPEDEPPDSASPNGRHFVQFSADATGELLPGDSYRIIDIKPGPFDAE